MWAKCKRHKRLSLVNYYVTIFFLPPTLSAFLPPASVCEKMIDAKLIFMTVSEQRTLVQAMIDYAINNRSFKGRIDDMDHEIILKRNIYITHNLLPRHVLKQLYPPPFPLSMQTQYQGSHHPRHCPLKFTPRLLCTWILAFTDRQG